MPNLKRPRTPCLACGKEPAKSGYKYCSNSCQFEYQHQVYISRWKLGTESGLIALGIVSVHIKRYLREKYGNRCCMCGWAEVNQRTGVVPLVADHIDGNWRNNTEDNLRLLCPNCDALTPTYAALNKGKGRLNRRISNRVLEARLLKKSLN